MAEALVLALAWQAYRWGRYLVRDQQQAAFDNADRLLAFESFFGIQQLERTQNLVLGSGGLIHVVNRYYVYTHVAVTVATLVWLAVWHHHSYPRFRNAIVCATGTGLLIHGLFPLAPPRMVQDLGLTDTLMVYGPSVYSPDQAASITNQFAAMPSFHVGWAVLVALAVITVASSPWRWLAVIHPLMMSFCVMATANHYLTDALIGAAVVAMGLQASMAWEQRSVPRSPAPLWG